MATPSYDEARRMLRKWDEYPPAEVTQAKVQVMATLAVAESLMAIESLLRAQDARARKVERDEQTPSE